MTQDPAAATRARAQAWLKQQGHTPTTLHSSAFKRLGAPAPRRRTSPSTTT